LEQASGETGLGGGVADLVVDEIPFTIPEDRTERFFVGAIRLEAFDFGIQAIVNVAAVEECNPVTSGQQPLGQMFSEEAVPADDEDPQHQSLTTKLQTFPGT
jgi:hypothetical protein